MKGEKAGSELLFYDTYALHAIGNGSINYAVYARDVRIVTSYMNLYEMYHIFCKNGRQEFADAFFDELIGSAVQPEPETLKVASRFRILHAKRKLSYIDCLGYVIAKEMSVPFLTGDEGFKGLPNVKFVKE